MVWGETGLIQSIDDNQAGERISEVGSLGQNNVITEATREAGSLQDVLSNNSEKVQDKVPDMKNDGLGNILLYTMS